jgi:hypothetical protein
VGSDMGSPSFGEKRETTQGGEGFSPRLIRTNAGRRMFAGVC